MFSLQPGNVCSEGEIRSVGGGGSVRIHHLTGVSPDGRSRFPKLEECAHFHYEHVELGPLQVSKRHYVSYESKNRQHVNRSDWRV